MTKKLTFVFLALALTVACGEDWRRGTLQLYGAAGGNVVADAGEDWKPSVGLGLAAGMGRYVAVTGSYAWNRLASMDQSACLEGACLRVQARAVAHELLGGLRLTAAKPNRFTPYVTVGGGLVRARASASAPGLAFSGTKVQPAFAIGGGVDVGVGGPVSAIFDFRAVKASEVRAYARASAGIGFRFR
jgi:opacity protein-like surface antigen